MMGKTLRFLGALLATNLRASLALRGAFWVRAAFMFANNLIFLVMWWVFFDHYGEVRGWQLRDMLAIYAVCAGVFGASVVLGAGVSNLARMITAGDLDALLTQPKPVLLAAVASKSEASGWGDLASAGLLFGLSGYATPTAIPLMLVAIATGCAVYLSTAVIIHSSAFWAGDTDELSRHMTQYLIVFSIYPKTIYAGYLKLALFTILPAGFITFLQVDLVRRFEWSTLAAIAGGTAGYALLAVLVFSAGLRRYESGNRFGVRS